MYIAYKVIYKEVSYIKCRYVNIYSYIIYRNMKIIYGKKIFSFLVLTSFSYFSIKAIYKYILYSEVVDIDIHSNTTNLSNEVNPFSVLEKYKYSDIFLEEVFQFLYLVPITNKLFIHSNLYGHELIRYYDF